MAQSDAHYDYVTIGHVSRDVIQRKSGKTVSQAGGGAFYSALQAARLGLRTLILTQGVPDEIRKLLEPYLDELELHVIPAEHTTTLATSGTDAARTQRVLAWAGPMLEQIELDARILHLAPIARETPNRWRGIAEFVGITPQGLIRDWQQRASVSPIQLGTASLSENTPSAPLEGDATPPSTHDLLEGEIGDIPSTPLADDPPPWPAHRPSDDDPPVNEIAFVELDSTLLPDRFDAAVISRGERSSCDALFTAARANRALVAVTAGARPTTVHLSTELADTQSTIPPTLSVCDDIGAGDVFAAAFFIALNDGRTALDAAAFGNAAAAIRLAGEGPGAIGGRDQIEAVPQSPATP